MALNTQSVPINFTGGLERGVDPKLVLPGKMLVLNDAVFVASNTISRRAGYSQVTTTAEAGGTSISGAKRLAALRDELLVEATSGLHTLVKGAGTLPAGTNLRTSQFTRVAAYGKDFIRTASDITSFDACAASGTTRVVCVAFTQASGDFTWTLVDDQTGAIIMSRVLTGAVYSGVRIVWDSGASRFHVYVIKAAAAELHTCRVDPSVPNSTGIGTTLEATDILFGGGFGGFDAAYSASAACHYFAYQKTGTFDLKIVKTAPAATTRVEAALFPYRSVAVGIFASGKVCVMAGGTGSLVALTLPANLGSSASYAASGSSYIGRCAAVPDGNNMLMVWDVGGAASTNFDTNREIQTATITDVPALVASTNYTVVKSLGLASKPFTIASNWYVCGLFKATLQPTLFVVQIDSTVGTPTGYRQANIVARLLDSQSNAHDSMPFGVIAGMEASTTATLFAFKRSAIQRAGGTDVTPDGIARVSLAFATTTRPLAATEYGGAVYFAGANPLYYDGFRTTELGFHTGPDPDFVTVTAGAGGNLSAGTYQLRLLWEHTDAAGRRWWSIASTAKSAVANALDKLTVVCPMDRLTRRIYGETRLVAFRTKANGTTFYRDTPATGSDLNDASATNVTLTFTTSDTSLESSELLPTTGGLLDSEPFPAHRLHVVHQDRLVMAALENPYALRFTDQLEDGYAPSANELYELQVPPSFGKVTGLASMDDKLIVSCERGTWFFAGQGPNQAGTQSTFSDAQTAVADAGCREDSPNMVLTPDGVWFRSAIGLRLLTRGLAIAKDEDGTDVGSDVDSLATGLVSAVLMKGKQQVRFFTGSTVLVYDYLWRQWSRFTNFSAVDALEWLGVVTHLRSDGTLYQESSDFQDVSTPANLSFETAWIQMAGLAGFQRARWLTLLMDSLSASIVGTVMPTLELLYDYDDTAGAVETVVLATAPGTTGTTSPFQIPVRHRLKKQKCTALKLRLTAVCDAGTQLRVSGMRLEVALKSGGMRLPAGGTF
jgi:hypothetical protein